MFWRLLVLWVFPAAAAAAGFSWGQVFPPRSSLVVGVFVEGREVGVVEALATEAGVCLSLPDFARLTGTHWDGRVGKLQTPLGEAFFKPADLLRVDDGFYLCPEPARSLLGVEMEFNPVEVTVTLDLPWAVAQPVSWVRPSLVPEVRPPAWGVGTLRGDLWVAREGDTNQWMGSALVTGRALAGQWRLVVDQTTEENPTVRELLWVRSQERTVFLVGRSFLQPSPLLSGLDLVGVQWVWSNEPLPKLGGGWGVALPFATALRSFRGPAPVGSLVRLKLDGFVVASQTVGVSGRYEFVDVPVAARGVAVVEVEVYDRHNLLVPREVRREVVAAAAPLLSPGRRVHALGFGLGGNLGRQLLGEREEREPVASYSLRWGLSQQLTLEFLAQARRGREQVAIGFAAAPTPWWLASGELAYGNGATAYLLESFFFRRGFEVSARFLRQQRTFPLVKPQAWDRQDHSVELRRFIGRWLEVGLWAREHWLSQERVRWIRPTLGVSWGSWLFARAFPDQSGFMSGVVTASPHPRLRLAASLSRTDLYDLQWELGGRRQWVWRTTWETGGTGSDRLTTTVGNRPAFWGDLSWRVGVSRSGPQVGPYLEASLRLLGGFWLRAEYAGVPTRAMAGQRRRPRLFVGLTADYAYSSGLLTPTGSLPLQRETGAIAGRLWVADGRANLAGARVMVWGVGGTTTDSGGRFFLGSVPPGVYEVELDPDKLPLELVPKRSRVVVEVQAGVTTRVDFPMEVLVGMAGRVTDAAGRPVAGVRVVLEGEQSIRVKETSSDEFGLFRFDQVPVGTYILRAVGPEGTTLTWRQVELREFLFDQDLQLPPLS